MARSRVQIPALLALALACAAATPASAQIGIVAGYNRDMIEEFSAAAGYELTGQTDGFHLGIFFNVNIGPLGIRPSVIYHQVPDIEASDGTDATVFNVDIVEVPLDIRLRMPVPLVRPYILVGPVLSFPSTSLPGVDALLQARPFRFEVGAGLELDLGFRLWPELRYGRGLEPFMRSAIPIGEGTLQGTGNPRLDTFTIRLGISF